MLLTRHWSGDGECDTRLPRDLSAGVEKIEGQVAVLEKPGEEWHDGALLCCGQHWPEGLSPQPLLMSSILDPRLEKNDLISSDCLHCCGSG